MSVSVCSLHACSYLKRPEEGIKPALETTVTGGCEVSNVDAER